MLSLPTTLGLLLPLALAACGFTPQGTAVREFVKVEGAKAYDEGLINAEWFICNAASIGAIMRRYGQSEKSAKGWRALCLRDPAAQLVIAPTVESIEEKAVDPRSRISGEPKTKRGVVWDL